jgi:hypothetical protein
MITVLLPDAICSELRKYLRFSGTLRSVDFWYVTDVSGQPICSIFKVKQSKKTLEDGTDRLSETSVTYYQSMLRNIPEERRCHLHHGGSLKPRELRKCFLLSG